MILHSMIEDKDIQGLENALSHGESPNIGEDIDNITPLHFAAQINCIESVKLLVCAGADIYALSDETNVTPLDIARLFANNEITELLERCAGQSFYNH